MSAKRMVVVLVLLLACSVWGCGAQVSGEALATARTAAQLDTTIARSSLPGARVVDRAMRESGRQGQRATSLDSLQ